jgi:hypothetical protein
LGKKPILPPPFTGNRGGGHQAPAALGFSGGHREGKRGRGPWETRSPPRFGPGRSEPAAPRRPAGGGRRHCGGGVVKRGGGQGVGQKREEEKGVLERPLPRAEVKRGGGSAVACGSGSGCAWRRRWRQVGSGQDGATCCGSGGAALGVLL